MSEIIERKISNLIQDQFPEFYQSDGPVFVQFVTAYYKWLETYQAVDNFQFVNQTVVVAPANNTVLGTNTIFQDQFANGSTIAIWKSATNYDIYTVAEVSSNTELTLTEGVTFSNVAANFSNTHIGYNPLYHSRRMTDYRDIDQTTEAFLVYFKQKYLQGIQFSTRTNTREFVKHALDLYRSKGTERSVDLLFRIVFGTPTSVYYPSKDIFRLSAGKWTIPVYLEISLTDRPDLLVNRQIYGVFSGATAFVEKVVRRTIKGRLIDLAYIDPINGDFTSGELIDTQQDDFAKLTLSRPIIIGSLTTVQLDTLGSGQNFSIGDLVTIDGQKGGGALARVANTTDITGQISFNLANGGYGYSNSAQILISDKVLFISNVSASVNNDSNTYYYVFDNLTQPQANIDYVSANGISANLTGNVSVTANSTTVTGTGTGFDEQFRTGDYISVWTNSTFYESKYIATVANATVLFTQNVFSATNTSAKYAQTDVFAVGDNVYTYFPNSALAAHGQIMSAEQTNSAVGVIFSSERSNTLAPAAAPNVNGAANVVITSNTVNIFGADKGTNAVGNVVIVQRKLYITGDGNSTFDHSFIQLSANVTGNFAVNSTSVNVTGNGTTFTTQLTANQYLSLWTNSTFWQTRQIDTVVSNTVLTVKQVFSFANAATKGAIGFADPYVTAFQNSTIFEIRQINTVVNSSYMTIADKFSFTNTATVIANVSSSNTRFLIPGANQTGTVAWTQNSQNVTGTATTFQSEFAAGDQIALWTNSTAYTMRTVSSITSNTLLTLTRPPFITANTSAVYSIGAANSDFTYGKRGAVWANSTVSQVFSVNAVVNDSFITAQRTISYSNSATLVANANVSYKIYNYGNTISANISVYSDRGASGNVMGVSVSPTITVTSLSDDFLSTESIYQLNANGVETANATLTAFSPSTGTNGILAGSNAQGIFRVGSIVRGRTSGATANVAQIDLSLGLIDVTGTFTELPYNYTISGSATRGRVTSIGRGSGATFSFDDLIYPEYKTYDNEFVGDFLAVGLDALSYGFDNMAANLTACTIVEALSLSNVEFGKIYQLTGVNPGQDYTIAPFVTVYEKFAYGLHEQDTILMINSKTDNFAIGELITQTATGARGLVKSVTTISPSSPVPGATANSIAAIAIERLRLYDNTYFVVTSNSTTTIVGQNSAASANIDNIVDDRTTKYLGINAQIDANAQSSDGAVTILQVVDSGFGFSNGETITFANGDNFGSAVAIVSKEGRGRGFYQSRAGFLSDASKLYDGYYYQEFSYDIRSPLTIDLYRDMLNKTIHVAGTQMFGSFFYVSQANTEVSIEPTTITVS
jgi:hypothetical protein